MTDLEGAFPNLEQPILKNSYSVDTLSLNIGLLSLFQNLASVTSSHFNTIMSEIPPPLRSVLLPLPKVSIATLLNYDNLPSPSSVPVVPVVELMDWLSTEEAPESFQPAELSIIPLPPSQIVTQLVDVLKTPESKGLQSVLTQHLPPESALPWVLPLWVITYWSEVYIVRRVQQEWNACILWMSKKAVGSVEVRIKQRAVVTELSYLPWDSQLRGGIVAHGSVRTLTTLLGEHELLGDSIAQLVGILRQKVKVKNGTLTPSHHFVDADFTGYLVQASTCPVVDVDTQGRYTALRDMELDLVHGLVDGIGGVYCILTEITTPSLC